MTLPQRSYRVFFVSIMAKASSTISSSSLGTEVGTGSCGMPCHMTKKLTTMSTQNVSMVCLKPARTTSSMMGITLTSAMPVMPME